MPGPPCAPGFGVPGWSFPHLLVDRVLRSNGTIKSRVLQPASRDVPKIALAAAGFAEARAAGKGLNCNFIQALSLFPGSTAKRGIQIVRYITNRVLHAQSIGIVGMICKQAPGIALQRLPPRIFAAWGGEDRGLA